MSCSADVAGVGRVQQEAAGQAEELCLLEQNEQHESMHSVNNSDGHPALSPPSPPLQGEQHSTGAEMERSLGWMPVQ